MNYDSQILQILTDVGERGISVQLLSKHLYNMNVSLFAVQDVDDIKAYVRRYLQKNSRSPKSFLEKMGRRGFYRLNTKNNAEARQVALEFKARAKALPEEKEDCPEIDYSLDLFA